MGEPTKGLETMTLWAPPFKWAQSFLLVKMPVEFTTYSAPASPHLMVEEGNSFPTDDKLPILSFDFVYIIVYKAIYEYFNSPKYHQTE